MDREKVIRGIECLLSDEECDLRKCSYGEFSNCINKVLSDALALLKEQENESKRNPVIVCPHCGKRVK